MLPRPRLHPGNTPASIAPAVSREPAGPLQPRRGPGPESPRPSLISTVPPPGCTPS